MAITKKEDQKTQNTKSELVGNDTQDVIEFEVEVETVEENKSAEEMLPASQVMQMIAEMRKESDEKMRKLEAKMKNNSEKSENKSYMDDIEDDYLETPIIFFAYTNRKFIYGDYRNGKEVLCPDGKIEFKSIIRQKRKDRSGGEQVVSVSSAEIRSKNQADFLRKHTNYNVTFYEQIDAVKNVDAVWASKLIEANTSLAKLSDAQIIERCKREGVKIGTDLPKMRRELLEKIAKEQLSLERKSNKATFESVNGYSLDDDGRVVE
jgi:hypothetical protein